MNNKLINYKKKTLLGELYLLQKKKEKKIGRYPTPDLEPDPLFPEPDPRIRIKMKQFRNTGSEKNLFFLLNCL